MNKNIVIGVIVVILIVLGVWFFMDQNTEAPVVQNTQNSESVQPIENNTGIKVEVVQPIVNNPDVKVEVGIPKNHDVVYTNSGYSPSIIVIKAGDTVTFKNDSSDGMWTTSGIHPSHTVYSGTSLQQHCPDISNTSFDECQNSKPGESWSFTFTKKGTWGYHNHSQPSTLGKVVVE